MANSKEITQLNQVVKGLKTVNTSINTVSTSYLTLVKNIENGNKIINNNAISFNNLKTAQKETKDSGEKLDKLDKQLQATKQKLIELDDKRQSQLLKSRAEIQKQTKSIKDLNRAKQAEKGSNEQLIAVNTILEKRLRNVNQTTDKGKRSADLLRSAIDKNNKKIKEQSSALTKQKINIGNYGNSMQNAAGQASAFASSTGLFSSQLMVLSKVQAGYTILTQKKTQAEIAGAAATGLGTKALNIFKIALLSTGIGAILVALGSLVAFFKASEEGAASLQRIMSPFKILFGNIKDLAISFGGAIAGAFENPKEAVAGLWEAIKTNIVNRFTGLIDTFKFFGKTIKAAFDLDFDAVKENAAKAGGSLIQSMTGIEDAVGKATRGIKNLAEETKKENDQNKQLITARLALIKRERDANVELAILEVGIQENRLKLKDEENLSNAERLVFAEKAQDQIRQQVAIETELSKKRTEFKTLENTFSTSSQEDLDEEARLKVELINVEAAGIKKLLRIESEKQTILKKINADRVSETKDVSEQIITTKEEEADSEIELEIDKLQKLSKVRTDAATKEAEELADIERQKAEEIADIATSMGDALGALASSQIKTFKEFSKEILFIALNALEKKILITQVEILASDIGSKGFFGIATAAVKIGLIKAAFSGIKGAIAAFHMGTDSTPSEFIAGDKPGGGSAREIMSLRDGTTMMVNEPTYFSGNKFKGATIKSNKETEAIMSLSNTQGNVNFDVQSLKTSMDSMHRTIKNKPVYIVDKDHNVIGEQINNSKNIYLNKLMRK